VRNAHLYEPYSNAFSVIDRKIITNPSIATVVSKKNGEFHQTHITIIDAMQKMVLSF